MELVYRKTRGGAVAIFGPADVIYPGAVVQVRKKDGTVQTETIKSVGKIFSRDGIDCRYGYRVRKTTRKPDRRDAEIEALREELAQLRALLELQRGTDNESEAA